MRKNNPKTQTEQREELRAKAAKRLLESSPSFKLESLGARVGKLLSALATLLSIAPINGVLASLPLVGLLVSLLGGWALCLSLIFSAAYLTFDADNATLALRFFLLGWVGVGALSAIALWKIGSLMMRLSRRWLVWNFSFLIGEDA
ncbi:MAG: hypothetical protein EOP05_05945 [Proteobacteria bacterium]|nr:MAG: hypothetical protein EOP05_05945 [Pseudomonadota bacterium]